MASTSLAQDRVGVLQQSINEVLLHTGKALKAAQSQEARDVDAIRSRLSGRMTETMDRYQNAVDDIEHEVLDAKAVLLRDLKAVRARIEASKQASQQAAAAKPEQPKAPVSNQATPQTQTPMPAPFQGPSGAKGAQQQQQQQRQPQPQAPPVQRSGSQQSPASRPVAPVPDMGVGVPQPQAQTKQSSPLLNKKTPSSGTPTPAPKPSPQMNGAVKPGAKPSPASRAAVPTPVPTPKPVPTAATTPPVLSTPTTSTPAPAPAPASAPVAPAAAAPVPMMDASQGNELLNLPPTTSGGEGLNFTDMAFTVAQGNDSGNQGTSQSMTMDMPGSNPEVIDIESLFDTAGASGGDQSGAPTAPMDVDNASRPADQGQQSAAMLDDMYDLGGGTNESMDLDFAFDQSGGNGGDSYIDDLLFGTGDGSLGELDESGLG